MSILTLIQYLPEIYSLVSSILKHINEAETNEKVKSDLASIKKAFDEKDVAHLSAIFNGMPVSPEK
jgi:hypothetical protein